MRRHFIYIIAALLISFIISACVEEPTISPASRPYSSISLGNFSDNVVSINVEIDGEMNFTIAKNQLTEHFDVTSGQRKFVITNNDGDTLYSGNITISSYEEITFLFSGYSAPGDELNNTFNYYPYSEGVVYLNNGPEADTTCWIHYLDVISDTPNDTSKSFIARCVDMDDMEADPVDADEELTFNTVQSIALEPGNKKFLFLIQTNDSEIDPTYDTLGVYDVNLEGGVRHYLFLTGKTVMDGISTVHKVQVPLPVRSK